MSLPQFATLSSEASFGLRTSQQPKPRWQEVLGVSMRPVEVTLRDMAAASLRPEARHVLLL